LACAQGLRRGNEKLRHPHFFGYELIHLPGIPYGHSKYKLLSQKSIEIVFFFSIISNFHAPLIFFFRRFIEKREAPAAQVCFQCKIRHKKSLIPRSLCAQEALFSFGSIHSILITPV